MPDNLNRLNTRASRWSPRQLARRVLLACVPQRSLLANAPGSRSVFLTFDDGPHPEHTPRLLDALDTQQVRATFFLLGSNCDKYPNLVRRIASEGHAIGSHTYSHLDARTTRSREYMADVRRCEDVLRKITGAPPRLFRPPYGRLGATSFVPLVLGGRTVCLWSVDVRDYDATLPEIYTHLAACPLQDGDILLMHDVHPHAAEVLPSICEQAAAEGLTCRDLLAAL